MSVPALGASAPLVQTFGSSSVRTLVEGDEVWFVAKDVFDALGVAWKQSSSLWNIPEEWRVARNLRATLRNQHGVQGEVVRQTLLINFKALCKVAFRSNRPEADAFTNWAAGVIEQVVKTGRYEHPGAPAPEPLTSAEQCALRKIVDTLCRPLPCTESWRAGIWARLRAAANCPAPMPFNASHLPALAAELRRTMAFISAYQRVQQDATRDLVKRVLRGGEPEVAVMGELEHAFAALALRTQAELEATLARWQREPLIALTERQTGGPLQ